MFHYTIDCHTTLDVMLVFGTHNLSSDVTERLVRHMTVLLLHHPIYGGAQSAFLSKKAGFMHPALYLAIVAVPAEQLKRHTGAACTAVKDSLWTERGIVSSICTRHDHAGP